MKKLIISLLFVSTVCFADQRSHVDSWKNYYAVAWNGSATVQMRYAKHMGYEYVAPRTNVASKNSYITGNDCAGLKFYLTDPNWETINFLENRFIDTTGTHTQTQIDWYGQNMTWKGTDTFPNNLASGAWSNANTFAVIWDVQQQRVIDYVIDSIISLARSYERTSVPFVYSGNAFDAPQGITSSFRYWTGTTSVRCTMAYWTGTNSCHGSHTTAMGITHDYPTYKDGYAEFYKQLNARTKRESSSAKWIIHPWLLYNDTSVGNGVFEEWVYQLDGRTDKAELTADLIIQENGGMEKLTDFIDNSDIYTSGLTITTNMVGSQQINKVGEYPNRILASKIGVNGSWYSWFGLFTENVDDADVSWTEIEQVYPRVQLVKCIPNWDNLNNVPIGNRATVTSSYGTETYRATHTTASSGTIGWSYIGQYAMYSRHWRRPTELFVVKMGTDTHLYDPVVIGSGEYLKDIYSTNEYFEPVTNVKSTQWTKTGNSWQINDGVIGTATDCGVGYIFTVLPIGGHTN